ncbi:sigma-70 family RNA polymerase sigma factor [Pseudonocardia sp. CA-142604]|uniref:sigma-70 family RNA polymerase sigma factor n=1 Tax=Pseudonocardia sp. CA-142604 TaxID=3240024 RepID=UPI003D937D8D
MSENFDDSVRTAMRQLDEPADLQAAYEHYRELERAYAQRLSSDKDAVAMDAVWRAITSWFRAEEADRTGDHERAAALFADAERHGLPDATGRRVLADSDSSARWYRADLELAAAAASRGDRAAVQEVLRQIRPLVSRYCRARLGPDRSNAIAVEELVQKVCLAVLTKLPTHRPGTAPFTAFVYGVASHAIVERFAARSRVTLSVQTPRSKGQTPPDTIDTEALLADLRALPAAQQDVIVMRIFLGLSAEETARRLGSTPGAVRVAQHRALARLRARARSEDR